MFGTRSVHEQCWGKLLHVRVLVNLEIEQAQVIETACLVCTVAMTVRRNVRQVPPAMKEASEQDSVWALKGSFKRDQRSSPLDTRCQLQQYLFRTLNKQRGSCERNAMALGSPGRAVMRFVVFMSCCAMQTEALRGRCRKHTASPSQETYLAGSENLPHLDAISADQPLLARREPQVQVASQLADSR